MMKLAWLEIAWNGFNLGLPLMMLEEKQSWKWPSSWRMMVKTSSQWCMDVVLGKAMSSSLSFFDRF
jgi:hypothetical protein